MELNFHKLNDSESIKLLNREIKKIDSEYERKALEFLHNTKTSIKIVFDSFDYHFKNDKEKRNIYKITLTNENHSYIFKFGDSIANTEAKIKLESTYSILACLYGCTFDSFEDFCDSFGYDKDDESLEIYDLVEDENENLELLFNSDQLELLSQIC